MDNKKLSLFAKRIWLINLSLIIVFSGYLSLNSRAIVLRALAQEQTVTPSDNDFEDYDEGGGNFQIIPYNLNYLYEQELFFGEGDKKLVMSPQDLNELNKCFPKKNDECKVDTRVINYLAYLVAPVEIGGAGFSYIKVGRILKNYNTQGVGKYDRETLAATEEDDWLISDHHTGQAVDITEVGQVTCKVVERRHIGGSKTKWQDPRGIKVAWQSKDGIARNPTPKGTSLLGISSGLSANAILAMLNETGEMDDYLQFVKGLDFETIISYVGMNIYLKNNGYLKITSDPLSNSFISILGVFALQKAFPDLPEGWMIGSDGEDIRVNIAKAQIEKSLDLPSGSLTGYGWNSILESTGKRLLEETAGLPTRYLDNHSLSEANGLETFQALYNKYRRSDDSFNFINGTVEKLKNNDKKGLKMAGVNILGDALKLSPDQKQSLINAVNGNGPINLNSDFFPLDREVDSKTLKDLFSEDREAQQEAQNSLLKMGLEILKPNLQKTIPKEARGITDKLISDLLNPTRKNVSEDVKEKIGEQELANSAGLGDKSEKNITKPSNWQKIANYFNKEFDLKGSSQVTSDEVGYLLKGKGLGPLVKIGSIQADRAFYWDEGMTLQILKREKTLEQGLEMTFSTALASSLGLDTKYKFTFDDNIEQKAGSALLESRLGAPKDLFLKRDSFDNFPAYELEAWFGIDKSKSLSELRADPSYWNNPNNVNKWLEIDRKMGLPLDSTKKALMGETDFHSYKKQVGREGLIGVSIDQIWNFFDMSDRYKLTNDEAKTLINTLRNWSGSSMEDKAKFKQLALKLAGRSFDSKAGFSVDAMFRIFTAPNGTEFTKALIDEGARHLALAMVANIEGLEQDDVDFMTKFVQDLFNKQGDLSIDRFGRFLDLALKGTNIPPEFKFDAQTFITGDYRRALSHWSAATWSKFANEYLPPDNKLSYEEIREGFSLDNAKKIDDAAFGLFQEEMPFNPVEIYNGLPDSMKKEYRERARKKLMQESQQNSFYKLSDAMLIKSGITIPKDFSKVMFSGTQEERAKLIQNFGLTALEKEFKKIDPSYPEGLLNKLVNGEVSATESDQLVLGIINRSGVSFGPFSNTFVQNFYTFLKNAKSENFYKNPDMDGMWSFFDRWLSDQTGIRDLPANLSKSIYFSSQNNWSFNSSLKDGEKLIVPSLSAIGENFLVGRLSQWGDKNFGLKPGTTYQIYEAGKNILNASRALSAAKAAGEGAEKLSALRGNLAQAQAALIVLAITIALNACSACQQFFSQIDRAIAAPPGFTNMLVAGALAMAFGLGPAGIFAALAVYFFGVYRVDFLCPLPPPDRYSISSYDPEYDRLEYKWKNDYYSDPNKPIMDTPALGQTPWQWQDSGVQWIDGNDEASWMFWSRYNTGRLLDATLAYGERQTDAFKPKQVITLRQANVEFFALDKDRMVRSFGEAEKDNKRIGLGFSQKSTKTTDWVHVSFGGLF